MFMHLNLVTVRLKAQTVTLTTMLKNNKIDGQLIVCFATYRQYRLEMAMFRLLHCWSSVSFETTRKEGEILPPVGDHDI